MNETNILILVLNNGDQLLAESYEQSGVYVCTNVLQILVRGDEASGQMSMGMAPYLPYSVGDLAIPTNMAILAIPNDTLLNHYKSQFGGIITPPAQKIFLG